LLDLPINIYSSIKAVTQTGKAIDRSNGIYNHADCGVGYPCADGYLYSMPIDKVLIKIFGRILQILNGNFGLVNL
jgi:hypothetical protein